MPLSLQFIGLEPAALGGRSVVRPVGRALLLLLIVTATAACSEDSGPLDSAGDSSGANAEPIADFFGPSSSACQRVLPKPEWAAEFRWCSGIESVGRFKGFKGRLPGSVDTEILRQVGQLSLYRVKPGANPMDSTSGLTVVSQRSGTMGNVVYIRFDWTTYFPTTEREGAGATLVFPDDLFVFEVSSATNQSLPDFDLILRQQ